MSIVEPIVGHLLSKYNETVIDGLAKIKSEAEADGAAAAAIIHSPQAMDALKSCAQRPELMEATLRAVCTLIRCCRASGEASSSATTSSSSPWSARCSEHSSRTHLIREFCRGASFAGLKKILATLADDSVPLTLAVLDFLTLAATYAPKLILARFGQQLPLNLACFRARLTYAQRRVRLARAQFLLAIVQSRFSTTSSEVMCAHGFISTLLGDVAELLLEGTTQGLEVGRAALDAFETYFLNARSITAAQKRATLMGQRSIFRLLVKALEYPPVAERAAELLHRVVLEMHESPADYASSRAEALDDRGMPNFILFFLLRQLRPRSSALSSRLLLFILHQAPDLIRPYYSRISSHLTEEVGESARSTSQVATINILTRIAMAPLPYHLQAERVRLREVSATVDSFYCMSPREVVDEIFPTWSAEYIHRMIKSSSNLLTLVLAMQATEAALTRARKVLAIIRNIQKRGGGRVRGTSSTDDEEKEHDALALVEEQLFAADPLSDWESFDANVLHLLLAALPRREEFWHRMTQQIHALMQEGGLATTNAVSTAKVQFITQRMMRLMVSYTDVFELRMPWISAVPTWLPTFEASTRPIADALRRGNDILATWEPSSIALLCQLLVSGLSSGVSMVKLHHITLSSSTQAGLTDWPLLLSVLLWATRHRGTSMERLTSLPLTMKNTLTWIARLLQWCVHGVSMQFGCELEEAMLWVLTLRAETIPCFLHMINSLLQRSLSKAADRVAEELFAGQSGILVAAANTFISKTAEKRAAAATTSSTTTSGGASNKNNNTKKEDLWSLDLQAHLTDFEAVVAEVVGHYAQRHNIAARLVGDVLAHQAETRKMEAAAQSSELLMMNATNISSSSSSRTLRGEMAPYLAPHDQVLFFCRNCRSPVQAATEIELEMQLQVGSSVLPLCRTKTDSSSSSSASAAQSVEELVLHVVELPRLLASNAVCWELAGRVLSELSTALRAGASMLEKLVSLRTFCVKLLEHLHQFEAVVLSAQAEQRDAATAGLNMLVLVCVRTLLYTPFDMNDDDDDVSSSSAVATTACTSSIARIIMAAYTGSISANDRIRYAILLTIHYYRETAANKKKNDNTSDDPPSMYRGALVPQEVAEQRFLISSHFPVAHQTPEIDMLTALIDAWSVEEVQHMALHMPARLSNTVVCHRRGRPALDLLRAVFSEISSEEDLVVAPFATATSARIMDVRYLLPLLHTVLALPATTAPHRFVGARCLPILIRGLSCTEAALRTFAASALHAAYMPNGPTKIVASLARLKLIQLANKQRQHHHNTAATSTATSDDAVVVPRLPAPLSALLVVALKPLGLHSDALHAHLLHLFGDVHALFTSPVPLSSWLTAFPLGAINAPLMMEQQLEMQKNGMQQSSIAHESATKVLDDLRREEPPHLRVVLQLLQHGCSTNGDAAAIIQSESLEALMMLVDLVASSNDVRLRFMEVLVAVCRTSQAVALQLADEGHLLSWAISFAHQLCAEFGDTQPHKYEGPLFSAVLELIFILSSVFVSSTTSSSSSSSPSSPTPTRGAAPNPAAARQERQLQLHAMEEQLQLLSERLHEAHVSARSTHERMKHTLSLFSEGVAKFFERVEGEGRSYVPRPRNISSSMHTTPHRGGAQRYAARGRGSSSSSLHRPAGGQRRPREAAAERTSSRPAKKISRA